MRKRGTALFAGAAVLTATLVGGQASAAEPVKQAQKPTEYNFTVFTGNKDGAGTNAKVRMQFIGQQGESPLVPLDQSGKNDMERGSLDEFNFRFRKNFGRVKEICVRRNDAGESPDWFLVSIHAHGHGIATFNRWILANQLYCKGVE